MLKDFIPPYESTATDRLQKAGAIIVGKTNMDEFGMGSATIFSHYGPTVNPWRSTTDESSPLVAGGSSGGSAVAVATRMCYGALGSDTGGSVRMPAAYCGVVGVKPSYGRISRWGLIAYASSLDCPGVLAPSVLDGAMLYDVLAGPDDKDSTAVPRGQEESMQSLLATAAQGKGEGLKGMVIGIPDEYRVDELPEEIMDTWNEGIQHLREAGASIVSVSLPHTMYALPAYYVIAPAEASSNLSRYDGIRYGSRSDAMAAKSDLHDLITLSRSEFFGAEVQRRILAGSFVLSSSAYEDYFESAQKVRHRVRGDFTTVFNSGVDALLTPVTPSGPYKLETEKDPVSMYLNDIMTIPPSLAGLPAISVPVKVNGAGLPLSLQVIGPMMGEGKAFRVASALERACSFDKQVPQYIV
jgi:aspartyl-tRNA(Asn)/glutamyl-tRNA(Gln) amidotransferase subunit A